ncbi:MAG: hypothetical protein IPP29_18220 [Bacteroidetes bacterium]|nr:hypothetical protein [Bacteroidota bacterium]
MHDTLCYRSGIGITVNDVPFTITMQTLGNESDFARGILFPKIIVDKTFTPKVEIRETNSAGFITSCQCRVVRTLQVRLLLTQNI